MEPTPPPLPRDAPSAVEAASADALKGVLRAGVQSWQQRWPALALAGLVLALASAPIQWFSSTVGVSLQRMSAVTLELQRQAQGQGGTPTPEQGAELWGAMGSCCGAMFGNIALSVLLLAPVAAGATLVGAQVARGGSTSGALGAGFRRYWSAVWVGTLCIILGGGVSAVASVVASAGARLGLMALSDLTEASFGLAGQVGTWGGTLMLALGLVWGSARLWLALYRLVDPLLPAISATAALRWSWQRTRGPAQWRIVAVLLAMAAVAGAVQVPIEWMAVQTHPTVGTLGRVASPIVAITLWLPWVLAVSGHVYARLAPR